MAHGCVRCRYFLQHPDWSSTGWCRRYPPEHHSRSADTSQTGGGAPPAASGEDRWPQVDSDHWCGEYQDVVQDESAR